MRAWIWNTGRHWFWQLIEAMPDFMRVRLLYLRYKRCLPNLRHPQKYTEKIQWRKLYDRREVLTRLCDKYRVKEYVKSRIGDSVLPKVYWASSDVDTFDLASLPDSFVLKPNHGSNWVMVVKDKRELDVAATKAQMRAWLSEQFGGSRAEWGYAAIEPLVYAEELLQTADGKVPSDYKMLVFDGKVQFIVVEHDRFGEMVVPFYDRHWNLLKMFCDEGGKHPGLPKPINFEQMMAYAETLAAGIDFVRVDFYNIEGRLYFGEYSVYPASGFGSVPADLDLQVGVFWRLDQMAILQASAVTNHKPLMPAGV